MDPYSLLTDDDKAFAQTTGLKVENAPDLFTVSEGKLVWTIKGLQVLRFACDAHGLSCLPSSLETDKDLIRLAIDMSSIRLGRLQNVTSRRLRAGSLPAQERDFARAAVSGTLDEVLDAAQRQHDCTQAGENVIPAPFGRRRTDAS
jgi:alkanesulfonate monooxygenase SsuD/methylene tetrahydromethanopterin reductase-like flavin-dependent oxidoreductase (luciferase family)